MLPWKHDVFRNNHTSWFTQFERHGTGGFSMAAHQANKDMEDYSQVEVGDNSLFVGIYDGNAANFFSDVLLHKLSQRIHESNGVMSYDLLREAITETKNLFKDYRKLDSSDTSYLISLLWKGTLYVASYGDSRLVIGTEVGDTSVLKAEQLTTNKSSKLKIHSRIIRNDDRCLILASSGFWNIMDNEEAMLIVERHSKHGIARRLLEKALKKVVAAKGDIKYEELVGSANPEQRMQYHDDITVIVVFLNHGKSIWKRNVPKLSYKAPSTRLEPLKSILAVDAAYL